MNKFDSRHCFESPIGPITIWAYQEIIVRLELGSRTDPLGKSKLLQRAEKLVLQSLSGRPVNFDLPLELRGTDFQVAVWREIGKIPFGATSSYLALAKAIDRPLAVRAVGQAVGSNPIPLIIGCHRVLGSSGRITGYSGGDGIPTKRTLLALEKIIVKD